MTNNTTTHLTEALDQARKTVAAWENELTRATTNLQLAMVTPTGPAQAAQAAADRVQLRELVQVCTEGLQAAQNAAQNAAHALELAMRPDNWEELQRIERDIELNRIENERRAAMKARQEAETARQQAQAEYLSRIGGNSPVRPPHV